MTTGHIATGISIVLGTALAAVGLCAEPPAQSDYGGVHFVALVCETHYLNEKEQERQARWIDRDLALLEKGSPVIVVTHCPENWPSVYMAPIRKYGLEVVAVLRGHYHTHNVYTARGIPVICSAPWRSGRSKTEKASGP